MDITNFMTWFLNQVVRIFTYSYNTLDSITFMGTSLLRVSLTILILGTLIPILLTIVNTQGIKAEKRAYRKNKGKGE